MALGHQAHFYSSEHDILGFEEFVDATVHRLGDVAGKKFVRTDQDASKFDPVALIEAVECVFGLSQDVFCGPDKNSRVVMAKEVLILIARSAGATTSELSILTGIDTSSVSRRHD